MNYLLSLGGWAASMSEFIDAGYPDELSPEAVAWRRISKVSIEANEALDGYANSIGENFRKGVTCSTDHVIEELLDTAFAALCAVEHLSGASGRSPRLLYDKAQRVLRRAGLLG